jgi:TnpA family transposase
MAAEILGSRWNILIIRELFLGSTRFNELRKGLPKLSPTLLSRRLKELEDHGVLIFKADDKKVNSGELKKIFKIKIDGNDNNDEEVKKDIRIKINSDDMSDIDIQSIFEEIQAQLTDEEFNEVRSKLEDARSELENALTEASDQLDNVDIDIQVEVENN